MNTIGFERLIICFFGSYTLNGNRKKNTLQIYMSSKALFVDLTIAKSKTLLVGVWRQIVRDFRSNIQFNVRVTILTGEVGKIGVHAIAIVE